MKLSERMFCHSLLHLCLLHASDKVHFFFFTGYLPLEDTRSVLFPGYSVFKKLMSLYNIKVDIK